MKRSTILIALLALACIVFCACGTGGGTQAVQPGTVTQAAEPSAAPVQESSSPEETPAVPAAEPEKEEIPVADAPGLQFETTDREGNPYDQSIFSDARLTLVNFWEPWCGPCVQEMPELQKLYEDYAEKGLQIIGVYSTSGMEDDVDAVLDYVGTTYPILLYTDVFNQFQTGYVPTTVFIDSEGDQVGETAIGSRSYSDWEALVLELMP